MPAGSAPSRRVALLLVLTFAVLCLFYITPFKSNTIDSRSFTSTTNTKDAQLADETFKGHAIMPKLGNETAKQELGRAAWKLLHTTMARFPDKPTQEESGALKQYLHLFQRLYPCGECATHFGKILDKFPPQTSSRSSAAVWACHVHNEVNKSLDKEIFDCSNIGDFYDCGCAEDEADTKTGSKEGWEKPEMNAARKEKITGDSGRDFNEDLLMTNLNSGS